MVPNFLKVFLPLLVAGVGMAVFTGYPDLHQAFCQVP